MPWKAHSKKCVFTRTEGQKLFFLKYPDTCGHLDRTRLKNIPYLQRKETKRVDKDLLIRCIGTLRTGRQGVKQEDMGVKEEKVCE